MTYGGREKSALQPENVLRDDKYVQKYSLCKVKTFENFTLFLKALENLVCTHETNGRSFQNFGEILQRPSLKISRKVAEHKINIIKYGIFSLWK